MSSISIYNTTKQIPDPKIGDVYFYWSVFDCFTHCVDPQGNLVGYVYATINFTSTDSLELNIDVIPDFRSHLVSQWHAEGHKDPQGRLCAVVVADGHGDKNIDRTLTETLIQKLKEETGCSDVKIIAKGIQT